MTSLASRKWSDRVRPRERRKNERKKGDRKKTNVALPLTRGGERGRDLSEGMKRGGEEKDREKSKRKREREKKRFMTRATRQALIDPFKFKNLVFTN